MANPSIGIRFWVRPKMFLSATVLIPLSFLPDGYGGIIPREESGQDVTIIIHLHLVPKVRKPEVMPSKEGQDSQGAVVPRFYLFMHKR
jgi:hypothetical protein